MIELIGELYHMNNSQSTPTIASTSSHARRRRRSLSHEREGIRDDGDYVNDVDDDDDDASVSRAANALRKRGRRRDASPGKAQSSSSRPRRRCERADYELLLAMPSLCTNGVVVDSRDLPAFVRTVVKNKASWSYLEIDALARVTGAHSRRAACWDFEFGTLVLDWWATKLPAREPRPRALLQQPGPLTRELIEAIVKARCEDSVYRLVVRAATLLYLVPVCVRVCMRVPTCVCNQLQGDSTPRDLHFAVSNCGARVELITTNWTRMLLADIEVIRVRGAGPLVCTHSACACMHRRNWLQTLSTSTSTSPRAN